MMAGDCIRFPALALFGLFLAAAPPAAAADWSAVKGPSAGAPRAIGTPTAGCLAGGVALPPDGPGYQAVRISRKRTFGHPRLVGYVKKLGHTVADMGLPPLYVGDLGQARGGPASFGHASHQNGLDVDIWYNLKSKPDLPAAKREDIEILSLVLPGGRVINPATWTPDHVRVLDAAARPPEVDRLFVHYAIKRHLCDTVTGDRAWLRKVRPWRGHDEHFHVRLACPGGADCVPAPPPPEGDGCGAELAWWFDNAPAAPSEPPPPRKPMGPPKVRLPAACMAVLKSR